MQAPGRSATPSREDGLKDRASGNSGSCWSAARPGGHRGGGDGIWGAGVAGGLLYVAGGDLLEADRVAACGGARGVPGRCRRRRLADQAAGRCGQLPVVLARRPRSPEGLDRALCSVSAASISKSAPTASTAASRPAPYSMLSRGVLTPEVVTSRRTVPGALAS